MHQIRSLIRLIHNDHYDVFQFNLLCVCSSFSYLHEKFLIRSINIFASLNVFPCILKDIQPRCRGEESMLHIHISLNAKLNLASDSVL